MKIKVIFHYRLGSETSLISEKKLRNKKINLVILVWFPRSGEGGPKSRITSADD